MPYWKNNQETFKRLCLSANHQIQMSEIAALKENRKAIVSFHLYKQPTFGESVGWTVYHVDNRTSSGQVFTDPIVRRVSWNKSLDIQRAHETFPSQFDPRPSLEMKEVVLQHNSITSLLEKGSEISIPLIGVKYGIGLDGTSYGFKTSDHFGGVNLNWWESGPQQWQPFIAWTRELILYLEGEINRANDEPSTY